MDDSTTYALLDSGDGRKLERFGSFTLARPCSQAVWTPALPSSDWQRADASFARTDGNKWDARVPLPAAWQICVDGITFKIDPTDFGHLGIFPEQRATWRTIHEHIKAARASGRIPEVLNLFAYSGGSTLAAARAGAKVCHLDASKGMVAWARENAALNGLQQAPVRWIVDDVTKFLERELRRGHRYDGIILDPPTFGRGAGGEIFKIERDLPAILANCRRLLSAQPLFVLLSCHTPGFSPLVLRHLLSQTIKDLEGNIKEGEMLLQGGDAVLPVPSGTYAWWFPEKGRAE